MSKLNYFALHFCLVVEKRNEGKNLIHVPLRLGCVRIHKSAFRFHVYSRWLSFIDYIVVLSVVLNRKHCVVIVLDTFL